MRPNLLDSSPRQSGRIEQALLTLMADPSAEVGAK